MEQAFENWTNDILIKANRQFIIQEPALSIAGEAHPVKKEFRNKLHSFVVDWQIPKAEKVINA